MSVADAPARVRFWSRRAVWAAAWVGVSVGVSTAALAASSSAVPAPGRYAAQLCVSQPMAQATAQTPAPAATPASCGAVVVAWQRGERVRVVLGDLRYQLELRHREVAVVVMHGAVQVDEFLASYAQTDAALGFIDNARATHYELRLGALIKH